ncbi:hypothetical protein EAI_11234 [Harpegnathos saltator]|uniref:Uncharacterized protein n=1 Tax=Harpegnathos saltator TaxID=610380 RepID=E2BMD1_HARSA|nr:hypothetical protein EAI_11234 [Harpegnathos saltator]
MSTKKHTILKHEINMAFENASIFGNKNSDDTKATFTVVAESNSNPADADAAPEDPIRAKQSRLEKLKRNVAGSDCKSFRQECVVVVEITLTAQMSRRRPEYALRTSWGCFFIFRTSLGCFQENMCCLGSS